MSMYNYYNDGTKASLYEYRGLLSYSFDDETTEWHGSWTNLEHDMVILEFSYDGNTLRTITLEQFASDEWIGFDDELRPIRLFRFGHMPVDENNKHLL